MSRWSRQQRESLVAALSATGPGAPTACGGWKTADLAAHLYVRERRIDAMPGVIGSGVLHAHTDRVMASVLRVHSYDHLLGRIADGPPMAMRPVDEAVNLFEYFVHTEDVRRANGEGPRDLPDELERVLWHRLRRMLRLSFRRARDIQVEFVTEHGDRTVIGNGPTVRLLAPVGELVLFAYNRKDIAQVEMTGDAAATSALTNTRLGV